MRWRLQREKSRRQREKSRYGFSITRPSLIGGGGNACSGFQVGAVPRERQRLAGAHHTFAIFSSADRFGSSDLPRIMSRTNDSPKPARFAVVVGSRLRAAMRRSNSLASLEAMPTGYSARRGEWKREVSR